MPSIKDLIITIEGIEKSTTQAGIAVAPVVREFGNAALIAGAMVAQVQLNAINAIQQEFETERDLEQELRGRFPQLFEKPIFDLEEDMSRKKYIPFNTSRKTGRRSLMVKSKQDLRKQNQHSFYYNDVRTPEGEQMVYAVYLQEVTDEQKQALIDGGMRYTGRFRARGVLFHEFVLPDTEVFYEKANANTD